MQSSQVEDYPRTIKVISLSDQFMCANRFFLRAVPPDDMLEVKEIYTEILIRFNSDVAAAAQKILKIGVSADAPDFILDQPSEVKYLDKEFTADANGLLHVGLDLTPYIVNPFGDNWIEIQLHDDLFGESDYGTILIWKVDLVHTTENVRSKRA